METAITTTATTIMETPIENLSALSKFFPGVFLITLEGCISPSAFELHSFEFCESEESWRCSWTRLVAEVTYDHFDLNSGIFDVKSCPCDSRKIELRHYGTKVITVSVPKDKIDEVEILDAYSESIHPTRMKSLKEKYFSDETRSFSRFFPGLYAMMSQENVDEMCVCELESLKFIKIMNAWRCTLNPSSECAETDEPPQKQYYIVHKDPENSSIFTLKSVLGKKTYVVFAAVDKIDAVGIFAAFSYLVHESRRESLMEKYCTRK